MEKAALQGAGIALLAVAVTPFISGRFGVLAASAPFLILGIVFLAMGFNKKEAV